MKNETTTATDVQRILVRAFGACQYLMDSVRLSSKAHRSLLATPSTAATERLDESIQIVAGAKAEALDALSCLDSSMRPDAATSAAFGIDHGAHGGTISSALETLIIGQRSKMSAAAKRMMTAYKVTR